MSANKFRYYTVETTSVVKANSKTDAEAIARGRRGISGSVLSTETTVDRIAAAEARAASV